MELKTKRKQKKILEYVNRKVFTKGLSIFNTTVLLFKLFDVFKNANGANDAHSFTFTQGYYYLYTPLCMECKQNTVGMGIRRRHAFSKSKYMYMYISAWLNVNTDIFL